MATPLFVMFVLLVVLLATGVQIGVALSLAAMAAVIIGDVPMAIFSGIFYSTFESVPLLAIPFFVIAGEIMSQGTLARVLLRFSKTLVGHMHGGLAHISVMTSLFYGALCGSAPATLAAVGGMVLPSMKEEGYPEPFSAALCAAGGALGPIIPPSIAVILFGSMSGVSISDLFIAMIPGGILIAIAFMAVSYYYSRRYGYGRLVPEHPSRNAVKRCGKQSGRFLSLSSSLAVYTAASPRRRKQAALPWYTAWLWNASSRVT